MTIAAANAVFIDTNVLVFANVATAPLHVEALELLEQLWSQGNELWISRQIVREYLATVTRPQSFMQPMRIATARDRIAYFQSRFLVADDVAAVTDQLLALLERTPTGGKQVHDANVVATMLVHDVPVLVTNNTADFDRFSDAIQIVPLVAALPG